ncbi:hypothetical protein BDV95DRAFT_210103 [Massariosphaeria phaeospora]|uniref:Clr5 domain-containing protein n=1 Tax=Massariosphaeria phaeospora TaxID=100035 RepID=A0A7C8M387_9PLEO|nr:hypothetical protein BDV95DRAFT_210103 [Massariosphaeria phaeospora]
MSSLHTQLRFVDHPAPRAKAIPPAKWAEHEQELRALYQSKTLDELSAYMRDTHGFEPSQRQYIYKFDKWGLWKYNTSGRDAAHFQARPLRPQDQPGQRIRDPGCEHVAVGRALPPKRPKSMGSLQSQDSRRNSAERPPVPPKKRVKLARYMASRDPFVDPSPAVDIAPAYRQPYAPSTVQPGSAAQTFTSPGHQSRATTQTAPSAWPTTANLGPSPYSLFSSNLGASTNTILNTPGLFEEDDDWMTINDVDDSDRLLPDDSRDLGTDISEKITRASPASSSNRRRCFDSSRPIHTFSEEDLVDMKMAAHFLGCLGFESDAFELFAILLKRLKEPTAQPAWEKSSALISCVRSATCASQIDIARSELDKALEEPRDSSTDAEQFLYRMLLAETYARSDFKENEDFLSEIVIGCELANDKMLDRLPHTHRRYDILTYHYLNKCLEYLNAYVKDAWDEGSLFTDKEHLQIRLLERIPGPFELRRGSMGNPCLRSCLQWCVLELRSNLTLPESWNVFRSNDRHYMYWTDHIGLYCTLWERWQTQRRDCLGAALPTWMLQTEALMGITSAELLSIICGMIMGAALPRGHSGANVVPRARAGLRLICQLSDRDLGCRFLDTYSLLGTLLSSAPQRKYHDYVSFFVTHSTREREQYSAFTEVARTFARTFIEADSSIILPGVHEDFAPPSRRDSPALSVLLSNHARLSMESLASAISPFAPSCHSSELSAMRALRDQIQQAARRSTDGTFTLPSALSRVPTMSELSHMTGTLSLTSTQDAANAALDVIAATSHEFLELFSGFDYDDPFRDRFSEGMED